MLPRQLSTGAGGIGTSSMIREISYQNVYIPNQSPTEKNALQYLWVGEYTSLLLFPLYDLPRLTLFIPTNSILCKSIPPMKNWPSERACFKNQSSKRVRFKKRSTAMYKNSTWSYFQKIAFTWSIFPSRIYTWSIFHWRGRNTNKSLIFLCSK